jgi:hypothetical protein
MSNAVDFDDGELMSMDRKEEVGRASHIDETESISGQSLRGDR